MWMTTIAGKEEKMEDISRCFMFFSLFRVDIDILIEKNVIKHTAFDHYEWLKSETSLAEYFKWIGKDERNIQGGFWDPVAKTFSVKGKRKTKRQLSKLAGNNANDTKPEKSKDFMEIETIVVEYREKIKKQAEQDRKDRETFSAIKTLIDKAEDKDIEKIKAALEKIKTVIT